MNNEGGTGITTAIILISFILIAATAISVIMGNPEEISEEDLEEMVSNIVAQI